MKKKSVRLAIILSFICIIAIIAFSIYRNKSSYISSEANNSNIGFKLKSAFADIDYDMVIQDQDPKDDDSKADYLFISFTGEIINAKKNSSSNPYNLQNYKLDNKSLPKEASIFSKNSTSIIIKLPNGYLNNSNINHSLEISKDLRDKNGQVISGDLNIKLPHSNSHLDETIGKKTLNDNKNSNETSSDDKNSSNNTTNSNSQSSNSNTAIPRYTIELGKGLPYTTIVLVKLDTERPEDYKVTVDGVQLELDKNSKDETVFVNAIKKDYELDQIKKLIKIEKAN